MESDSNPVHPPQEDKITLDISPIPRAQDAFALARYLCRRTHWPCFHMTSVADQRATFVTTRDGWQCLRETLETHQDGVLRIASIDGNSVDLRIISATLLRALEGSFAQGPAEDD